MDFSESQRDMRSAYLDGAPGVFASSVAWAVAGVVALRAPVVHAIIALFIGGMLIFPVSVLLAKALGRTGAFRPGNPLGRLALEGTFMMLACLPVAYAASLHRAEWFFPAMLLIIGGRYLTFSTLYGLRIYWLCGGCLALAGCALGLAGAAAAVSAFSGCVLELVFAAAIGMRAARQGTAGGAALNP